MTPLRHLLILIVLLATVAGAPLAASQLPEDELLDLDLKDADLGNTLRSLALIRDLTLDLGDGINGKVTASLDNVPWSSIVNTICDQHDLTCDVIDDAVFFIRASAPAAAGASPMGEAISLALRDADLFETLQAFGRISGLEVQIAPTVQPAKITVNLDNVPWSRALEGVCQLGNCRLIAENGVMRVEPIDRAAEAPGIEIEGTTTDLAALFAQFTDVVLMGQTVRTDIDPRARGKSVFLDVEDASWSKVLDLACRQAGCEWNLVFAGNEPLTLRVRFHDERLVAPLEMEAFTGRLEDAVAHLSAAMSLRSRLDKTLDPDVAVQLAANHATGQQAADALCTQTDCGWHLDGRTLVIRPRVPLLASGAPVGSRAPRVTATFTVPGDAGPHQTDARFSWAKPMHRLGTNQPGAWQLHLTWIPFADRGHVVVPFVARCGAPVLGTSLAALEPVAIPLEGSWHGRALGTEVQLDPVAASPVIAQATETTGSADNRARVRCFPRATHRIHVTFPDLDRQTLAVDARPGAYLLVTPPPRDVEAVPAPAIAVVVLGATATGDWSVGLVRPGSEGAEPSLERIELREEEPATTTLDVMGQHSLSIRMMPTS